VIGNIVWLLLAGWWFALGHLVTAILLAVTCSAAECCGCTTLPAASAACGAARSEDQTEDVNRFALDELPHLPFEPDEL
jgi:hypothetical protein